MNILLKEINGPIHASKMEPNIVYQIKDKNSEYNKHLVIRSFNNIVCLNDTIINWDCTDLDRVKEGFNFAGPNFTVIAIGKLEILN